MFLKKKKMEDMEELELYVLCNRKRKTDPWEVTALFAEENIANFVNLVERRIEQGLAAGEYMIKQHESEKENAKKTSKKSSSCYKSTMQYYVNADIGRSEGSKD